jgi:hypothetical protein
LIEPTKPISFRNSQEEFATPIRRERVRFANIVKDSGARADSRL